MRRLLLFVFLLGGLLIAQTITPIHDIQYTTDASGNSPLKGQVVTISGTVTVGRGTYSKAYFFMQDASGPWNGIQVYVTSSSTYRAMEGDSVQVSGTVDEYNGLTEITTVTSVTVLDSCKWVEPVEGTTAGIDISEQLESVLVKLKNVTVTNGTITNYAWKVSDGSGDCGIGTRADDFYYYLPKTNDSIGWIVGVAFLASGHNVVEPRAAYDFGPINGSTMIQSIEQVRQCDILAGNDSSLFLGDTLTITGIVTVQSGIMFAGAGKKYYLQQSGGGAWSGIMVYHPVAGEVESVLVGDSISVTGYVDEYWSDTYPGNTTEFRATSDISMLGMYHNVPKPVAVSTNTFNDSLYFDGIPGYEPEKYENVLVKVSNVVVDTADNYGPHIHDATGRGIWCSFRNYSDSVSVGVPAIGTWFESITGVIYHHFGYYELMPCYDRDIKVMAGPPIISGTGHMPLKPQPEDTILVSTSIVDDGTVTEAKLFYAINSGSFTDKALTHTSGYAYEAKINPQAKGDTIRFYISAKDNDDNTALDPATAPASVYSVVITGPTVTTIYAIQSNTGGASGDSSLLSGELVKFTATVTSDTSTSKSQFFVQDFANTAHSGGAWNGVMIYSNAYPNLAIGDNVEVIGIVQEYYGCTEIANIASVTKLGGTTAVEPTEVTSADICTDSTNSEPYEGVLVKISSVMVTTGFDSHGDWRVTDAEGDTVQIAGGSTAAYDYVPTVGDVIEFITGNLNYSYNQFEIVVRGNSDIGSITAVKGGNDQTLPVAYRLDQNYPNPFNPLTTISYGIEKSGNVTLRIYNILGQEVVTLVHKNQNCGNYTITWNGLDKQSCIVPAGVYIYQIVSGDYIKSKKMILLK